MVRGWFIIARSLLEHWIWLDKEPFCRRAAWIDLIALANHTDSKQMIRGKVIETKRGEVNRSIRWLAERWHWSRSKVERFLKLLEKEGMLSHETRQNETVLTICNYCDWQDMWKKNEPQSETETSHTRATGEPHTSHTRATGEPQASHEQRIIKNYKELKRNYSYSDDEKKRRAQELDDWLLDAERRQQIGFYADDNDGLR